MFKFFKSTIQDIPRLSEKDKNLSKIKSIIDDEKDFDINQKIDEFYPLSIAIMCASIEIVKYFISIGANKCGYRSKISEPLPFAEGIYLVESHEKKVDKNKLKRLDEIISFLKDIQTINIVNEDIHDIPLSNTSKTSNESINTLPVEAVVNGNLWKILVNVGDKVEKGQVVAILEAMMMEIDIEAPVSGTISSIDVGLEDVVIEGQKIATIITNNNLTNNSKSSEINKTIPKKEKIEKINQDINYENKTENYSRHIRIFISSTFRDMQEEREALVKKVFPELKKIGRKRNLEITEIDLRWGVTQEDSENGKALQICLDEIEKCNSSPIFFISMLGDRYGWIPDSLDGVLNHTIKDADGKSVTELEIMLANKFDKDDNFSFYYFRSPELTQSIFSNLETALDDEPNDSIIKQNLLKANIRNTKKVSLDGYLSIDQFSQKVSEDLMSALDILYPEEKQNFSSTELINLNQKEFINNYTTYIENNQYESKLKYFLESDKNYLIIKDNSLSNFKGMLDDSSYLGGLGKTAFIVNTVKKIKNSNPNANIQEYYCSVIKDYIDLFEMIGLRKYINPNDAYNIGDPESYFSVKKGIKEYFKDLIPSSNHYIFIDGIENLDINVYKFLSLFPSELSSNIKVIISIGYNENNILEYPNYKLNNSEELIIYGFSNRQKQTFIEQYLLKRGKKLDSKQLEFLLKYSITSNPFMLKLILQEIVYFGIYEKLDNEILNLTNNTPAELLALFYNRLVSEYGEIILDIFAPLIIGVTEDEVLAIYNSEFENKLTRQKLSEILLRLDLFINNQNGELSFLNYGNKTSFDILNTIYRSQYLYTNDTELDTVVENTMNGITSGYQKVLNYFENYDPIITDEIRAKKILVLKGMPYDLKRSQRLIAEDISNENKLSIKMSKFITMWFSKNEVIRYFTDQLIDQYIKNIDARERIINFIIYSYTLILDSNNDEKRYFYDEIINILNGKVTEFEKRLLERLILTENVNITINPPIDEISKDFTNLDDELLDLDEDKLIDLIDYYTENDMSDKAIEIILKRLELTNPEDQEEYIGLLFYYMINLNNLVTNGTNISQYKDLTDELILSLKPLYDFTSAEFQNALGLCIMVKLGFKGILTESDIALFGGEEAIESFRFECYKRWNLI